MSVKLYRHKESGEKVYADFLDTGEVNIFEQSHMEDKTPFLRDYTLVDNPLPEAPEVGSAEWAVWMLNSGEKLENPTEVHGDYIYKVMDEVCFADGWVFRDFQNYLFRQNHTWRLYTPPKPIVELLPHEFVEGQEVLVRVKGEKWQRRTFCRLSCNGKKAHVFATELHDERVKSHKLQIHWKYFIPYAENEHLEGTITDGEHGAVQKGYVPPHVPQLGDDDYWCVGDAIRNIATMALYKVMDVNLKTGVMTCEDTLLNRFHFKLNGRLCEKGIRVLYHYDENFIITGKVEDNPPTRPHKIIDTDTYGA